MKEEIIQLLKTNKLKLSHDRIMNNFLNLAPDLIISALNELNEDNVIGISKNNDVYYIDNQTYFKGTLKLNPKGFGFVSNLNGDVEESDYFVPPVNLNNALSNDLVVYKLEVDDKKSVDGEEPKYRAVVVDLLERNSVYLVGELNYSADKRFLDLIPTSQEFASFRIIMVNKADFSLKNNLLLKVKILRSEGRKLFVRIVKIIGNALKAADRIIAIAEEFNIKTEFNTNTLKNAQQVGIDVNQEPIELQKRMQHSIIDRLMVTIDGIDSKDLDDSICVEKIGDEYRLTVAIADVSHYVLPKSALDNEALIRGNSTYLVNVVIPMLPEILSNQVCSLNPGEQKFCMVAEIMFNKYGNMVSKKVYESVMISKSRLNYDEVNKFFAGGKLNHSNEVSEMLKIALELHEILEQERTARGTINFEIREPKIILDDQANVVEISSRTTGTSEKLIENFMVSANEAVAEIIFEHDYPFVYRNHGKPEEEDLIKWYSTLRMFGIDVKLTDKEKANPLNINKTLKVIDEQFDDPIEKELLNLSLLRYMDKAKYALENIGHFGLASTCYTHFTSPIRRYSDLMVHRYLKQYLFDKDLSEKTFELNTKFINKACLIINDTETNSVDTEREVNKICMVEYMNDKVGQEFNGVIAIALKFGIFIQLENMVEGLVHISNLPAGTMYDEQAQTLTTPNNKVYRMGQKVKVKVLQSDLKTRKIDFQFVE